MPDISKCNGYRCPLKSKCYRFTSTPSPYWQSYMEQPGKRIGRKWVCDYFMPNDGTDMSQTTELIADRPPKSK
jgi:hypothetical protein